MVNCLDVNELPCKMDVRMQMYMLIERLFIVKLIEPPSEKTINLLISITLNLIDHLIISKLKQI